MKLKSIFVVLVLLIASLQASTALACDCVMVRLDTRPDETNDQTRWRSMKAAIDRAELVVTGEFVPSTINHKARSGVFEVQRVVKGQNIGTFIRLYVSDGSNCEIPWLLKEAQERDDPITLSMTRRVDGPRMSYLTSLCHLRYHEQDLVNFLRRSPASVRDLSPKPL